MTTTTKAYFLEKSDDRAYWYRFAMLDNGKMEINRFWSYDIQRTDILTKDAARKVWKRLLTEGYVERK